MKKIIFVVCLLSLVNVQTVSADGADAGQALFDGKKAGLKTKFEKALKGQGSFRKLAISATGLADSAECKDASQAEACNKNVVEGLISFAKKMALPTAYSQPENKSSLNTNLEDMYLLLNNDLFVKNVEAVKYEVASKAPAITALNSDRLPSSIPNATKSVEMMVVVGNYKTNFKIWEENNNQFYSYYRAPGRIVQEPLPPQTFTYFFKKAALVSHHSSNNVKKCPNKSISLTITDTTKTVVKGCVGSKTKVAKELTRLANLIDMTI